MAELSGFPYFEVQFDKEGDAVDPAEADALLAHLQDDPKPTDLVVISHGWNNDIARARELYGDFFASLRQVVDGQAGALAGRRLSVAGIFWPSKKFADSELIPGGAAAVGDGVSEADLEQQIDDLKGGFEAADADQRLARARDLVIDLEDSPSARRRFVDELRGLLETDEVAAENDLPDVGDDFMSLPGDVLLDRMGTPSADEEAAGATTGGGAAVVGAGDGSTTAGGAAGLGDLLTGIKAGAQNFLNLLTYYKMKDRAGMIGSGSVHDLLRRIHEARGDLELHLVGHSFGGRLVTAAVAGREGQAPVPVATMTLLQAAYSHHGMAENWDDDGNDGLYRRVLADHHVSGPVLITHTVNDRAVGRAYPLASRLARQVASALGDADDKYGGMGRNGAQKTPEARFENLLDVGGAYALQAGAVHNLLADTFIADHSDVASPQTAYALLAAIRAT